MKNNYSCDYCNKAYKPSYATFWQSEFVTVDINKSFPFNFEGPSTDDICLINPTTIKIKKEGVYQIYFRVAVNVSVNDNPNNYVDQRVSLYINGEQEPHTQASFGIYAQDQPSCIPISGEFIVEIPACSIVQLKNDGIYSGSSSITTCDNGVNAVTINIVKIG
ncbi:MAG: hypothetical protein ACRDD7_12170 [Peptostreptococcaceae bacterium]